MKYFLIAIDGRSGSGKSLLARHLATLLRGYVLELDGYHVPLAVALRLIPGGEIGAMIDWRRFSRDVLEPIRTGGDPVYRWASCLRDSDFGQTSLKPSVIVVDGTFSCRPELLQKYQFTIHVERERLSSRDSARDRDHDLPREWLNYLDDVWLHDEDRHIRELAVTSLDSRISWDGLAILTTPDNLPN